MTIKRFQDQVILITGAGSGIGLSYSTYFAQQGGLVCINDLTPACHTLSATLNDHGHTTISIVGNVCNDSEAIVKACIDKWGRIDVLVNNAGLLRDKSFSKMTDQEWDLVVDVHLMGTFMMTKAVYPHMVSQVEFISNN